MTKIYFITGTDTEVGKTVVSCALLQAAAAEGYQTAGYKPVASGSEQTERGLRNGDALLLQKNSTLRLNYAEVNPVVFEQPTSPHIISQQLNQPIQFSVMSRGLVHLQQKAQWLLVEGAGGWYTPLSAEQTFADWAIEWNFPIILTVGIKLGCINHALLTVQAIKQANLTLAGWVANEIEPAGTYQAEYLATLERMILAPCLGIIPHLTEGDIASVGQYLQLNKLAV